MLKDEALISCNCELTEPNWSGGYLLSQSQKWLNMEVNCIMVNHHPDCKRKIIKYVQLYIQEEKLNTVEEKLTRYDE